MIKRIKEKMEDLAAGSLRLVAPVSSRSVMCLLAEGGAA